MRFTFLYLPAIGALLATSQTRQPATLSSVTIDLLDRRDTLSRAMTPQLLLRLENLGDPNDHAGWVVKVLRQPVSIDSKNLIHNAPHGPDLSDVQAWHVAEKQFPNERVIDVRGYPITVTIRLLDPQVTGKGPEARFVSGRLRVSWERRR